MTVRKLKLTQLRLPPFREQRKPKWEYIGKLADDIAEHGLMSPLIVVKSATSKTYRILCGVMRYRALKLLRCPTVMCEVYDKPLEPQCFMLGDPLPPRDVMTRLEIGTRAQSILAANPSLSIRKLAGMLAISPTQLRRCIKVAEEAKKTIDKASGRP